MLFRLKYPLLLVVLAGAALRLWNLGSAEFFHDEGFYAFRSIGYLDYIQNDDQTTPIQWFKDRPLPWWTKLSFHDHPPLFFLIQHAFFRIFGDSILAARLPSAVAGVLSIYLVYLLAERFFPNRLIGLFAAFLLAVNQMHIWVSRSSLMESVLIFLILLNIYFFFRFLEDRRFWWMFGVTLGLVALTKYTGLVVVPAYLVYFLIRRISPIGVIRPISLTRLIGSFVITLLLFSPVIVYNIYLYSETGHFDLQLAYLLRQETPEWKVSLGKIQDPFSEIISNLALMYSIPFLLTALGGLSYTTYKTYRSYRTNRTDQEGAAANFFIFWCLYLVFITLMLTVVGSGLRFISLYAVPAIFLITSLAGFLFDKFSRTIFFKISIIALLAYELFFTIGVFFQFPDFGVVKLDRYFNKEFDGYRSLAIPASPNPHLNTIIEKNALRFIEKGKSILVVYDTNIALSPRLWLFTRRNYYRGIPTLNVDQFKNFIKEGGIERFKGYDTYFVKASRSTSLNPIFYATSGEELEAFLRNELNLSPEAEIYGSYGYGYDSLMMFTVYKFSI